MERTAIVSTEGGSYSDDYEVEFESMTEDELMQREQTLTFKSFHPFNYGGDQIVMDPETEVIRPGSYRWFKLTPQRTFDLFGDGVQRIRLGSAQLGLYTPISPTNLTFNLRDI